MEQLIKKIQKLREWEHLGLITTTGNTSSKGLNEFLLGLENEALRLFAVSGELPPPNCSKCGRSGYSTGTPFCTDDFCNGGNLR